jgi:antitoxin component YwqK of YwqJK toxin-antitoxin module
VSDTQPDKKPGQLIKAGGAARESQAGDGAPSLQTELPSTSKSASTAGGVELPTEVRETFFPNGATRRQWIVKILPDGTEVAHGESLTWHDNGQVNLQGEYVDGVREGLWLSWHPNGKDRGVGRLHRDRRVGTWTMWFSNGQKRSDVEYEVGLAHGATTVWDEDGNVIESGEYVRRKKHGKWIKYVDGVKTETEWDNGVQVE